MRAALITTFLVGCGASSREPAATPTPGVAPNDAAIEPKPSPLEIERMKAPSRGQAGWYCFSFLSNKRRVYSCSDHENDCRDLAAEFRRSPDFVGCATVETVWCFGFPASPEVQAKECQPSLDACRSERDARIAGGSRVDSECAELRPRPS